MFVNNEKFEVALRHDSRNLFVIKTQPVANASGSELALQVLIIRKNAPCRKARHILALALKGAYRIVKDQKTQHPAESIGISLCGTSCNDLFAVCDLAC
jgi:hypothetical protein